MADTEAYRSIKQWDKEDRPREKLQERGASALTDAEILAILLGSGTAKLSAVELAKQLIDDFSGIERIASASLQELTQVKGIGEAKALNIMSAFELVRRKQQIQHKIEAFTSPAAVAAYLSPRLEDLDHEVMQVLFLNNSNRVIAEEALFEGGINKTAVDLRRIFKMAFQHLATGLILSHNHPSGELQPSNADIEITRKIRDAGQIVDIRLLDHVIIGKGGRYCSFVDEGLI
jgi:DNA repair protein RadC